MFKEDSVDGILSVFNKTAEKLSALATKKSEDKRAVEAASRINSIVGG